MPEHHLSDASKDVIKLGMGLIGTIAALVLGLVIATAKGSYDTQDAAVKHSAAKLMLLDRVLADYGPETKETRALIKNALARRIDQIWPQERSQSSGLDTQSELPATDIGEKIQQLVPQNEVQRGLQARAIQIGGEIMETRWFVLGNAGSSIPLPFLIVVIFWLTIIFGSFGLLAPRNTTVITVLLVCALSVAGAIFLIMEMDQPFTGLMRISSAPLRYALSHLCQ
jgi:hypothetical protein